MSNLKNKIFETIDKKHIEPKSKLFFLFKKFFSILSFFVLILLLWIWLWHLISYLYEIFFFWMNHFSYIKLPVILSISVLLWLWLLLFNFSFFEKSYKIPKYIAYPSLISITILFCFLLIKLQIINYIQENWPESFQTYDLWDEKNWFILWKTIEDYDIKNNKIIIVDKDWNEKNILIDDETKIIPPKDFIPKDIIIKIILNKEKSINNQYIWKEIFIWDRPLNPKRFEKRPCPHLDCWKIKKEF